MTTLLIAIGSLVLYVIAYHTYGRWLARKFFKLDPNAPVPSRELADGQDFVSTRREILFGHHFTSIAGTGPIVGPALAVIWGWVPALLWVLFGSIFIGAVHDLGALVVSIRNRGQTIGEVAGRLINPRVKVLFLLILFLALTIVLAIFGLVIASIFDMYPSSVLAVWVAMPVAIVVGVMVYKRGFRPHAPALIALAVMLAAIVLAGEWPALQFRLPAFTVAGYAISPTISWTLALFVYCYFASVLPVWLLLQPRDYVNSYQLLLGLVLMVGGIAAATFFHEGGAPIVAPAVQAHPVGAPPIMPFLFVTIACGAISGFHCLVSSGTSSKQLACEPDAQFVAYGSMLTEGFLAVLVILACCAGLGLGSVRTSTRSILPGTIMNGSAPPWRDFGEFVLHDGSQVRLHAAVPNPFLLDADDVQYIRREMELSKLVAVEEEARDTLTYRISRKSSPYGRDTVLPPRLHSLPGQHPRGNIIATVRLGESIALQGGSARLVEGLRLEVQGKPAWLARYKSWSSAGGLAAKVGAFVEGGANFVACLGIPLKVAIALMAVLVASFAATTLDTATRLQRYVVQELAATFKLRPLQAKHGATLFAVLVALVVAAVPPPGSTWATGMGKGGLILWPLFGAVNQLLAGLAFLVVAFYLARRKMPTWFTVGPAIMMLIVPFSAMAYQLGAFNAAGWWQTGQWHLVFTGVLILALQVWMVCEALKLWPKIRGVLESELPPLARGFPVVEMVGGPGAPAGDGGRSC